MDLENLRERRSQAEVVFTKFIYSKEYHNRKLFCFFEGEDYKYYCFRITKYAQIDDDDIIHYSCNGKEQVLRVYSMLKKDYSNVKKMFFVDRDYDDERIEGKDFYSTECYSIENYYVSDSVFGKIIHNEFGINSIDNDYKKCLSDFRNRKKEFNSEILSLNSWLRFQKEKMRECGNVSINYQNLKLSNFLEIKIDELTVKKGFSIENLKKEYPSSYEISEETMNDYKSRYNNEEQFRGKYQIEFLRAIINDLLNKKRSGDYFSTQLRCVRVDPNNNIIGTFSIYADTPKSLKDFLTSYKDCLIQ